MTEEQWRSDLLELIAKIFCGAKDRGSAPRFADWTARLPGPAPTDFLAIVSQDVFDVLSEDPRFWFEGNDHMLLELDQALLAVDYAKDLELLACREKLKKAILGYDVAADVRACIEELREAPAIDLSSD